MKKSTIAALTVFSTLATINTAFAQQPGDPTNPFAQLSQTISGLPQSIASGIAGGFEGLEKYIGTLYGDGKEWVHHRDHRPIPNLAQVVATNTAQAQLPNSTHQLPASRAAALLAKQETTGNIHNTLMQYTYSMYAQDKNVIDTLKTADGKKFSDYVNNNSLAAMTVGTKAAAGDTLSVQDETTKTKIIDWLNDKPLLETPTETHNDFMDFSGLLNDTSYTTQQEKAAKDFVKYAAQSTQDVTVGINLSKLYGSASALLAVKQSPIYQEYVMTIRSLIANRSITLNTLNQLIAERTPMQGLGQAAGLQPTTPASGKTPAVYPPASPLQVEEYQATYRVEDPTWYANLDKASPATLQREQVVMLAEIEKQNLQAHLDRERILSELTALNLQMSTANTQSVLQQAASKVNGVIQSAVSGAAGSSTGSDNNSTSTTTNTNTINTNTTNTQKK